MRSLVVGDIRCPLLVSVVTIAEVAFHDSDQLLTFLYQFEMGESTNINLLAHTGQAADEPHD